MIVTVLGEKAKSLILTVLLTGKGGIGVGVGFTVPDGVGVLVGETLGEDDGVTDAVGEMVSSGPGALAARKAKKPPTTNRIATPAINNLFIISLYTFSTLFAIFDIYCIVIPMKTLKCADMGAAGCDFEATGETNEEVKGKMLAHVQEAHPEKMEGMDEAKKAEMDALMDSKIQG